MALGDYFAATGGMRSMARAVTRFFARTCIMRRRKTGRSDTDRGNKEKRYDLRARHHLFKHSTKEIIHGLIVQGCKSEF